MAQKPAKGGEKAGSKVAGAAKGTSEKMDASGAVPSAVVPVVAKKAESAVVAKKADAPVVAKKAEAPVKRPSLSAPRLKKASSVPSKTGVVRRKVEPLDLMEQDAPPKVGPKYIDPATDRIAEDAPPLPKPMTTFNL